MQHSSPTATELESTRVARYAKLNARTDMFELQNKVPKTALVVRKILNKGIVTDSDPGKRPAIEIEHPFGITMVEIPPGEHAPLHSHTTEEVFFVLEGQVHFVWGDQGEHELDLGSYDTVTMPKHIFRGFTNLTDRPARMLVMLGGTNAETMDSVGYTEEVMAVAQAHGRSL
ncbi:MAG: cupin domain-containing protein [Burkholderiales bacterium]|nr:cupin domain-containing protein [Burkholderiales bacterium]